MVFIARQEAFICEHCHMQVEPLTSGTYRNHCPKCLHSKCVDKNGPGDRGSSCQCLMPAIAAEHSGKKGWVLTHLCPHCKKKSRNKAAPDDSLAPFLAQLAEDMR